MKLIKMTIACLMLVFLSQPLHAGSEEKQILDLEVDKATKMFKKDVSGGADFLASAKGVLVFPKVYKAGLVVGGEYGEGALRINGKTVGYYSTAAASLGFQAGAQRKTVVVVFLTDKALNKFRNSEGWDVGADASVVIADVGAGENVNTKQFNKPIVGFILGNKGLMYNLTLEGSKITPINP